MNNYSLAPTSIMQSPPHLCHFKHSHFIVHMVLEGDGPDLKHATVEGASRRFWVVVFTLALQIREVVILCTMTYNARVQAHTLVPSTVLVSMTTMFIFWSHIICQKSSIVPGTGAVHGGISMIGD